MEKKAKFGPGGNFSWARSGELLLRHMGMAHDKMFTRFTPWHRTGLSEIPVGFQWGLLVLAGFEWGSCGGLLGAGISWGSYAIRIFLVPKHS